MPKLTTTERRFYKAEKKRLKRIPKDIRKDWTSWRLIELIEKQDRK